MKVKFKDEKQLNVVMSTISNYVQLYSIENNIKSVNDMGSHVETLYLFLKDHSNDKKSYTDTIDKLLKKTE
ncbi:hypothetical protein NWE55_00820 [Myroides albus]|uniref:Uncharacterized protein n=1 Tax=Myroides albus TaxID=2562892 RepID=A0A6I3LIE9_9FLAO|nr:hypothetical protein [Myroides albus]MTG99399.1 hypothetical protein [Myroides albus]UVD79866.1 hypothetical protein NWE55_00820 [Myroides albus]